MRLHDANARSAPAEWQAAEPLDPAAWIPLTELALEGFGRGDTLDIRAKNLRHALTDQVLLDDIGRACVPRSVARQMFAERAQAEIDKQGREAAARAEYAANDSAVQVRARVRALQAKETTGNALADMKRDDIENSWDRAAQARDELTASQRTGRLQHHPIREQEQ